DDVVAVADVLVDHRVAPDAQDVAVAAAGQVLGHGYRLARRDRLDGGAGCDVAEQRQFQGTLAGGRGNQLDGATAVPRPSDEALLLQVGEVLVNRGERGEVEAIADFFEARRIPVALDVILEKVEDLALPFGERLHRASLRKKWVIRRRG